MINSIVQKMVDSYLETALWSSTSLEDDTPLDDSYDLADFTEDAWQTAQSDCETFIELLDSIEIDDSQTLFDFAYNTQGIDRIGHDFWLTRNGHGAGFWDGDYNEYGDDITQVVEDNFGECYVLEGSNGSLILE